MKNRARKTPTERSWTNETAFTSRICARIPIEQKERLKRYVDATMLTTTDVVVDALEKYLKERGF